MLLQVRLYRFLKLGNIAVLVCQGILAILEEIFLDKIIAWLRVEVSWVDNVV